MIKPNVENLVELRLANLKTTDSEIYHSIMETLSRVPKFYTNQAKAKSEVNW